MKTKKGTMSQQTHGDDGLKRLSPSQPTWIFKMSDKMDRRTTINLEVNLLGPAKTGLLTARGEIVHKGKRIGVGDAKVTDQNGRLVSKGTTTYMILENGRHAS